MGGVGPVVAARSRARRQAQPSTRASLRAARAGRALRHRLARAGRAAGRRLHRAARRSSRSRAACCRCSALHAGALIMDAGRSAAATASCPSAGSGGSATSTARRTAFCCYGCCLAYQVHHGAREEPEAAAWLIRLGVGGFLAMNIMLFSLLLYAGHLQRRGRLAASRRCTGCCGCWPRRCWCCWAGRSSSGAWQALRQGRLAADTLVALGALAAYGYSAWQVLRGSRPRLLRHRHHGAAAVHARPLPRGAGPRARRAQPRADAGGRTRARCASSRDGIEAPRPVRDVRPGDLVRVLPGERIAGRRRRRRRPLGLRRVDPHRPADAAAQGAGRARACRQPERQRAVADARHGGGHADALGADQPHGARGAGAQVAGRRHRRSRRRRLHPRRAAAGRGDGVVLERARRHRGRPAGRAGGAGRGLPVLARPGRAAGQRAGDRRGGAARHPGAQRRRARTAGATERRRLRQDRHADARTSCEPVACACDGASEPRCCAAPARWPRLRPSGRARRRCALARERALELDAPREHRGAAGAGVLGTHRRRALRAWDRRPSCAASAGRCRPASLARRTKGCTARASSAGTGRARGRIALARRSRCPRPPAVHRRAAAARPGDAAAQRRRAGAVAQARARRWASPRWHAELLPRGQAARCCAHGPRATARSRWSATD